LKLSKSILGQPCYNKYYIVTNWAYFLFFSTFPWLATWTMIVSKPANVNNFSFFTCWLVGQEKNSPITTPHLTLVHLHKAKCFTKESSLGMKKILSPQFVNKHYNGPSSFSHLPYKYILPMKILQTFLVNPIDFLFNLPLLFWLNNNKFIKNFNSTYRCELINHQTFSLQG